MLLGIRNLNRSYPGLVSIIEASGEHTLSGYGEIYLDSVLKDLREKYAGIEIKISDPWVNFRETVIETSCIKGKGKSGNGMNEIAVICEPVDEGLSSEMLRQYFDINKTTSEEERSSTDRLDQTLSSYYSVGGKKELENRLREKYGWDILASKSVWAFGPDQFGSNMLIDDTLGMDKGNLLSVKPFLTQGFQWCTKEGPLCEEPIRGAKFKIIEAQIASDPIHRAGGQLIPTMRRTCYSSFLMANPRIQEPMLLTEIQCTGDSLPAIYNVLNRRRGHLISENAKPGSPLFIVKANIPALDSYGFETDLRCHTTG